MAFDADGLCDAGDPDDDNDGLSDADEVTFGTNPFNPDTDGDGVFDRTEVDIAEGSGYPDPLVMATRPRRNLPCLMVG